MIAGLMSNNAQSTIDKAPGVGDIPILGSLFRSNEFRKGQSELVIVVTPYLVNPVSAGEIKLPTDGFETANLGQQLFGNMNANGKTGGDRPKPTTAPDANVAPKVGELLEPEVPAAKPKKPGKPKTAAAGDDALPGFSLN
jgi:pilus assembly protein CpaC